jgi:hypothetical protein
MNTSLYVKSWVWRLNRGKVGIRALAKNIGTLLFENNLVTKEQLIKAVSVRMSSGDRLASICYKLGFVDEASLVRILSKQIGLPFVILSKSVLSLDLIRILPKSFVANQQVLPLYLESDQLLVALSDHHDSAILSSLRSMTSKQIVIHGALEATLAESIKQAYRLIENNIGKLMFGEEVNRIRQEERQHIVVTNNEHEIVIS